MKTPVLKRFLQLDYSNVGGSIHSAPIEHPLGPGGEQVDNRRRTGDYLALAARAGLFFLFKYLHICEKSSNFAPQNVICYEKRRTSQVNCNLV